MEREVDSWGAGGGDEGVREVSVSCVRECTPGRASPRTAEVGLHFGISLDASTSTILTPTDIPLAPAHIVLLLGPSGSGKSSAMMEIDRCFAGACMVDRVQFPPDLAVVDRVAPWAELVEAGSILTACGLSEPHLWVRRYAELSDGEKFRARLACAVAEQSRTPTAAPLLCDEFCALLHRRAARAVSFNLRKLVTRRRLTVVVASCHEDVIHDLQPNVIVRFRGAGRCDVQRRDVRPRRLPRFPRGLVIERGGKRDYDAFAAMHYRAADELGFVDKVFVLRDKATGDALGIVVYAHSPLELALRNQGTEGYFSRRPRRVNRELRILRRLVIHPDVRGCGLGHNLVRKTLPQIGTSHVECLAAMGDFNPVFEKAGMTKIGRCAMSPRRQAALDALRAMDVDPYRTDFAVHVARQPRVRAIVTRVVHDWYAATTGGGQRRVERQSPQTLARTFRGLIGSQPVYYLWRRDQEK